MRRAFIRECLFWGVAALLGLCAARGENFIRFSNVANRQEVFLDQIHRVEIDAHSDSGGFEWIAFQVESGFYSQDVRLTNSGPAAAPYFFNWRPYSPGEARLIAKAKVKDASDVVVLTSVKVTIVPAGAPWLQLIGPPTGTSVGGSSTYTALAFGRGKMKYQWLFNGEPIPNATSSEYTIENIQVANILGQYQVQADNFAGRSVSLPKRIFASVPYDNPGGLILFDNHSANVDAPVTDAGNNQRISGDFMIAEIYAGPSITQLSSTIATVYLEDGYVKTPFTLPIPSVAPGQKAYVQICVWQKYMSLLDSQYRGFWGKSKIIEVTTGTETGAELIGLEPFKVIWHTQYNVTTYPFAATGTNSLGGSLQINPGVYYYVKGVKVPDSRLSYQWLKNTVELPAATERRLVLNDLKLTDAGAYTMVVTDGIEVRTLDYQVKVESVPTFTYRDGMMQILGGLPEHKVVIEETEDFANWNAFQTLDTTSAAPISIPLPVLSGPNRYYRGNFDP